VNSVTIPHSDIAFSREGVGDRAIVFQHGFLDDQYVWNPVIAELTASRYEIVRLDLAGFGDRSAANGPFTYDRFAADLAAVVDALDKPFVLVGHSMAGPIVELVAAGRHDRALGVVLLSPIPMAGAGTPDEAFEMFRSLGEIGPEHLRGFRQQTAPLAPEDQLDRLVAVAEKLRPEVVRTVADVWNNGHPAGERPSGFSGPLLVLPGGEDVLVTAEVVASAVVARFPSANITVNVIDKAGHWPHLEQPSAVAAAINGFLAELAP
jgi:pimeloyl-ACP methyl ester carboxylesterase